MEPPTAGADPAKNVGIATETMVKTPLSLVLDQVIIFCHHYVLKGAVAANVHESQPIVHQR
jgi:hypothetical protein